MQENYLAKWLNGDLTGPELSEFKNSDEYASYASVLLKLPSIWKPQHSIQTVPFQNYNTNVSSRVLR